MYLVLDVSETKLAAILEFKMAAIYFFDLSWLLERFGI